MSPVNESILSELSKTLSRLSRGTSIAASNVANVDTPGYKSLQIEFTDALGEADLSLVRTSPGHRASREAAGAGRVSQAPVTRVRTDGNTVDIDREMTRLAALGGRFAATAQMLRKNLALLRYAATDGKQ